MNKSWAGRLIAGDQGTYEVGNIVRRLRQGLDTANQLRCDVFRPEATLRSLGAAILVGLAMAATHELHQFNPDGRSLQVFLLAVLASGLLLGAIPALLSAVLSIVVVEYFWMTPTYSFGVSLKDMPAFVAFVGNIVIILFLLTAFRRSYAAIQIIKHELFETRMRLEQLERYEAIRPGDVSAAGDEIAQLRQQIAELAAYCDRLPIGQVADQQSRMERLERHDEVRTADISAASEYIVQLREQIAELAAYCDRLPIGQVADQQSRVERHDEVRTADISAASEHIVQLREQFAIHEARVERLEKHNRDQAAIAGRLDTVINQQVRSAGGLDKLIDTSANGPQLLDGRLGELVVQLIRCLPRLDQPSNVAQLLALRFPGDGAQLQELATGILEIRDRQGHRAANQALMDATGVIISNLDEDYCRQALDYHLGLVFANAKNAERAAYHFERSKTLVGMGGNRIYSEHVVESLEIRRRQQIGIGRLLPPVVIASMPRSGSASLTQTLAARLDLPVVRASCGDYPNYSLVPRWLNAAASGGTVFHDHFCASDFNLRALANAGIRDVFIRVRDPRAAAYSNYRHGLSLLGPSGASVDEGVTAVYHNAYIPWLTDWIAAAQDGSHDLRIRWSHFRPGAAAVSEAARDVLTCLAADHPAVVPHLEGDIPVVEANFVDGDDDKWRQAISPSCQTLLWEMTPEPVRELFELKHFGENTGGRSGASNLGGPVTTTSTSDEILA